MSKPVENKKSAELIVEFDKLLEAVYDSGYDDAAHECDYDAMGSKALSNARLYFQQALNKLHAFNKLLEL